MPRNRGSVLFYDFAASCIGGLKSALRYACPCKTLTLPACSGYSQLKKTADKIYAFEDLRGTAAPSKVAKQPPQLFPDRTLAPMASLPVSLQPPYFSPLILQPLFPFIPLPLIPSRCPSHFIPLLRLTYTQLAVSYILTIYSAIRLRMSAPPSLDDGSSFLRTSARRVVRCLCMLL